MFVDQTIFEQLAPARAAEKKLAAKFIALDLKVSDLVAGCARRRIEPLVKWGWPRHDGVLTVCMGSRMNRTGARSAEFQVTDHALLIRSMVSDTYCSVQSFLRLCKGVIEPTFAALGATSVALIP